MLPAYPIAAKIEPNIPTQSVFNESKKNNDEQDIAPSVLKKYMKRFFFPLTSATEERIGFNAAISKNASEIQYICKDSLFQIRPKKITSFEVSVVVRVWK